VLILYPEDDRTDDVREETEGGGGDAHQRRWEGHLDELKHFKAQHGHCNVPQGGAAGDARWHRLARWAAKQQKMHAKRVLAPDRAARLEEMGFALDNSTHKATWEHHYRELLCFKQATGHCNVPTGRPSAGLSAAFTAWVDWQRRSFKANSTSLTPTQRLRLTAVGFLWDVRQAWWDYNFSAFIAHCRRNRPQHRGAISQKIDTRELSPRLKAWLHEQRSKLARGSLLHGRMQRLDASGVAWRAPNQTEAFLHRLNMLADFQNQHGHCYVPVRYKATHASGKRVRLGEWCAQQRKKGRRGLLRADRCRQLDALGFAGFSGGSLQQEQLPPGRDLSRWHLLRQLPLRVALPQLAAFREPSSCPGYSLVQGAMWKPRSRQAPRAAGHVAGRAGGLPAAGVESFVFAFPLCDGWGGPSVTGAAGPAPRRVALPPPLALVPGADGSRFLPRREDSKGAKLQFGIVGTESPPLWLLKDSEDDVFDFDNCKLESFAVPPSA
jgi:hypothetical protein